MVSWIASSRASSSSTIRSENLTIPAIYGLKLRTSAMYMADKKVIFCQYPSIFSCNSSGIVHAKKQSSVGRRRKKQGAGTSFDGRTGRAGSRIGNRVAAKRSSPVRTRVGRTLCLFPALGRRLVADDLGRRFQRTSRHRRQGGGRWHDGVSGG